MGSFTILIQKLKKKLFSTEERPSEPARPTPRPKELISAKPAETDAPKPALSQPDKPKGTIASEHGVAIPPETSISQPGRDTAISPGEPTPERIKPYFVQIGFDFGTSYSKCICRDVVIDKAWVYLHPLSEKEELPFLIPGALSFRDEVLRHVENQKTQYPDNGLYHIKHALVKVAMEEWDNPVLGVYQNANGQSDLKHLPRFVENCAIYYLAGALGEIRKSVRQRLPGFGALPTDYMAVNLAVPVADAQRPNVNDLYHRVLSEAWCLADKLAGHPPLHLSEIEKLRKENHVNEGGFLRDDCTIYPEVSANVQGFVRSRVSMPGMYFFSDTGAGTVDQSIFIFAREEGNEKLIYLHGSVLPLGSSHIEQKAADISGTTDHQSLESWRKRKEQGGEEPELRRAREWIDGQLGQKTESTIAYAREKLYVKDQIGEIRVIFGGGGHCDYPYKTAALRPFSGHLFRKAVNPDVIGLPIPRDLELKESEYRWMNRLNVAYGLSFVKSELAGFIYPNDVPIPQPADIWQPRKKLPDPISKDVC